MQVYGILNFARSHPLPEVFRLVKEDTTRLVPGFIGKDHGGYMPNHTNGRMR